MSTADRLRAAGGESIDVAVGKRVHTLMWEQRVKNKEIAELLELDPTAVGKKLRAEQKFSIEQLSVIAARLQTTIGYLVGETDTPHPTNPVGPTGLEPMTSTVEYGRLAPVTELRKHIA